MKKLRFYLAQLFLWLSAQVVPKETPESRDLIRYLKEYYASVQLRRELKTDKSVKSQIFRLTATFYWQLININNPSSLVSIGKQQTFNRVNYAVRIDIYYLKKSTPLDFNLTLVISAKHPYRGNINKTHKKVSRKDFIRLLKKPI